MRINKKLILGLSFTLIIVVIIIAAYLFRPEKTCVCNEESTANLSSIELISNYEENENNANENYLSKVITVTGKIATIKTTDDNRTIIELDGNSIGMVNCTMCPKFTDNKNLKEGDTIVIKGECVGYTIDVVLVKCCLID